jgi:hypothetical protein
VISDNHSYRSGAAQGLSWESGDTMKAPVKAGRESRMKEPHKKGIANHLDPESCADVGNHVGEALTGAHAGQPSSSEITSPGVPTLYGEGEGHIQDDATCEPSRNATESETLCMRGNSLHGNRETPKASALPDTSAVHSMAERPEKAHGRTSGVHVFGESDGPIVPQKQANKADVSNPGTSYYFRGIRRIRGHHTIFEVVPAAGRDMVPWTDSV